MKRTIVLLIGLFLTMAVSCTKNDDAGVLIPDTPRSEVPDELVGQWLNGTFSMSNWWTYNGQYAGNPYSSSRAFTLFKNGQAEFFQVIKSFNGACATEAFTYFKGTVKFSEDGSFTMYPQQGNFRGFYYCVSGNNFNRPATRDELNPIKLYWNADTDGNNQRWLVTRFGPDDPDNQASYFKATNW